MPNVCQCFRQFRAIAMAMLLFPVMPLQADITFEQIDYRTWPRCARLSNGICELVVVPQIGRIMHFGFVGEANQLWTEPRLHGQTLASYLADHPPKPGQRPSLMFGGDKVWPWPQTRWAEWFGRAWPPPAAFDGEPHEVEIQNNQITLRSAAESALGRRVVRTIVMAPDAPRVEITSRLEIVGDVPASAEQVAAWSVAQLPRPDVMLILNDAPEAGVAPEHQRASPADDIAHPLGSALEIKPLDERAAKVFIDARRAVVRQGSALLTMTLVEFGDGEYERAVDRTQIFTSAAEAPAFSWPYVEVEFSAPPADESWMRVSWSLERVSPDARAEEILKMKHRPITGQQGGAD